MRVGIGTKAVGIGIPASCISDRNQSIPATVTGMLWFRHRNFNLFRYGTDRMPQSPALWHLKTLSEGEEGYTLHG